MSEKWLNLSSDSDSKIFEEQFSRKHSEDLESGEFWADRIKLQRGKPAKRLQTAIDNLPLPGAFREAAIAVRALIREHRRKKRPHSDELNLLYWLASVNSFSVPYAEKLGEPGFNILHSIPGEVVKSLPFTYEDLGYDKLELLNKTDITWLVEEWGQPKSHGTLHERHRTVWDTYEDKLITLRKENQRLFLSEINDVLVLEKSSQSCNALEKSDSHNKRKHMLTILVATAALFTLIIIYIFLRPSE